MPFRYEVSPRVSASQLSSFLIGKLRERAVRALTEGVETMKREVVTRGFIPVNLGALQQGILAGGRVDRARLRGIIGTSIKHGPAMEGGRRAGLRRPPIRAIRRWVERKGIAPTEGVNDVAYVIARKIGREGTKVPLKYSRRGAMMKRLAQVMAVQWPQIVRRRMRGG